MMAKGNERNPIEGVDIRFGYEISRDASPLQLAIVAVILPHDDLILEEQIQMKFIHSSTRYADKGGVLIQIFDERVTSYFPNRFIREKDDGNYELTLPWLESKRAYPLSVWFYSVRNLLKLEKLEKWRGSPLLNNEFRNIIKPQAEIHGTKLFVGVGRNRGRRNYMEDQDFIYESINISHNHHISVFGVLDGHGGIECSQYGVEEIPMKIAGNLRKSAPTNPITPEDAMFRSFAQVDREFLYSFQGSTAGSTANVMLFDGTDHMCYIANTGDTRAILSRDQGKEVYDLSYDRKATDPEEIARIARCGGFVEKGRVLGSLAVSRALGDAILKLDSYESVLICDPEITGFFISQRDDFIVIASDGLWDVMSSQEVGAKVHSLLQQENVYQLSEDNSKKEVVKTVLNKIASQVTNHAIEQLRSADNVTVMIILILSTNVLHEESSSRRSMVRSGGGIDHMIEQYQHHFPPSSSSNPTTTSAAIPLSARSNNPSTNNSISSSTSRPSSSSSTTYGNKGEHKNVGGISSGSSSSNHSSRANSASNHGHMKKAAGIAQHPGEEEEEDDDLMSFLKDDTNF